MMKVPILVALVAFLTWAYGPGLPLGRGELQEAFGGKRVVVCGASYGIGAEIAFALARSNASLVLAARSKKKLENVANRCKELGAATVHVVAVDLSTKDGSKRVIEAAITVLGGLDMLILNHIVGMYEDWAARIMTGHQDGSLDSTLGFVDHIFAVNTLSYVYLSSYALPSLAKSSGRIVAVGSAAGKQGLPRVAPYSSSKHAVFGYFDSLRQDLVASRNESLRGISVTTGVLGSFNTETARANTKGMLDHMPWRDPAEAALELLKAGARRQRTVYTPVKH